MDYERNFENNENTTNEVNHQNKIRGRKFRRNQRENHIQKRLRIKSYHSDWKPNRGYLHKGKVHCSCPLCSFHGFTMQDIRRADAMIFSMKDEGLEVPGMQTEEKLKKIRRNSIANPYGGNIQQKPGTKADMRLLEAETEYQKRKTLYENALYALGRCSDEEWESVYREMLALKESMELQQKECWKLCNSK